MILHAIWVATVNDEDGCYIPVVAGSTKERCETLLKRWINDNKDNPYWNTQNFDINEVPYDEGLVII